MNRPSYPPKMKLIAPAVLIAFFAVGNVLAWRYALTHNLVGVSAMQDPVRVILATPEWIAVISTMSALVAVKVYWEIRPSGEAPSGVEQE